MSILCCKHGANLMCIIKLKLHFNYTVICHLHFSVWARDEPTLWHNYQRTLSQRFTALSSLRLMNRSNVRKLASAVSCVLLLILDIDGIPNFTETVIGVPSMTLGLYQEPDLEMSSSCAGELVFLT